MKHFECKGCGYAVQECRCPQVTDEEVGKVGPEMRIIWEPRTRRARAECACGVVLRPENSLVAITSAERARWAARVIMQAIEEHKRDCKALGTARPYEVKA